MYKKLLTVFLVSALVLVCVGSVYYRRVVIGAWWWHFRHGTTTIVDGYVIPAPHNWYVEAGPGGGQVLIKLDSDDRANHSKFQAHAGITIFTSRPMKNEDVQGLLSAEENVLRTKGVKSLARRDFDIGSENLWCLGGARLGPTGAYEFDPITWHCKSSGGLDVSIYSTAMDLEQVWDIVSHIRKKS